MKKNQRESPKNTKKRIILALANQKGGVGKTLICFNLAKELAQKGFSVLAIDNDPQANLTAAFLEEPELLEANVYRFYQEHYDVSPHSIEKNLDLIGSDIRLSQVNDGSFHAIYKLKEGIELLKKSYDFILIDCVPSLGYLSTASLNAANYTLIPITPAKFSAIGLKDFCEVINNAKKRMNPDLQIVGIVLNLVEGRTTKIADEIEKTLREIYGEMLFKAKLNKGVKLDESPNFHQSIQEYDSNGKNALQFQQILEELLERLKQ